MNLKEALEDILFSGEDFSRITRGINSLYEVFSEATQVFAGDLTHETLIQTSNGGVVTPVRAAHCLKDQARTTHFLRAIHKAIEHYLEQGKTISILYAGCGPYGTLLTPFTALYGPDKIRFTFLEISEFSFDTVKKLYKEWKLEDYLEEVRLTDATDPSIQFPEQFEIIISETMQRGLKNECQVPITRNLVRFLKPGGSFIPQQIKLDVYLTGKLKDPLVPNSIEKILVGTAYDLSFLNIPTPGAETFLTFPESDFEVMTLYTTINLFEDERLTAFQSGLTLPLTLDRRTERTSQLVKFYYEESNLPKLKFEYVQH